MPEDKLKVLHQNLVKAGYDLPDETTFRKDMADDTKRTKFHQNLVNEGYELPDVETFSVDMGFKKKVPTTPVSSNGSSPTQPTSGSGVSQFPAYSVKVDEGPMRKGQPSTVTVGGKEFEVAPTPELTSTEVKSTANKLFKTASPITQTPKIPPSPAMEGVVKKTDEVAISNLSPKAASGNEDVLTEYISTLNEAEQNRLRGIKLNDEQSFEILTKAYAPRLEQAVIDLSILRDRGVENDLKAIDESQKQMQSLTQSISADKTALVDLQATFLKQKGYDKISSEYKNINKQLQVSQKEIAPILQEQQQIEAALKQFEPLVQNGNFVGSEQEYAAYQEAYNAFEQISNNPKLTAYNNLVQKQNEIASNINSMVTPEYKAQEEKLLNKINSSVASANTLVQNSQGLLTPEKAQNIELYKKTIDEYNAITNKLQTAKSKMPDVIEKEAYINAMNAAVKENPYLKAFDLSAKAIGGFTEAVGSMLSAVPKFAGGLSNEYTFSDKVAESITNFFAPAITNTQTTTAGKPSAAYQSFYDSETDHINWSSLPDEIANQAGAFAVLAGSGVLGGMAKFSEVSSVVVPGALISYNDAYQIGREIYGDDAYSATAYATASSLITGITELIMPDRDILTGGSVDKIAKNYVVNYAKKGKRFAIERSLVDLTEMMGKEVTEEFADRWKDVLLKGVVNMTGGDIENDIPTLNEQLSIAASTAALTGGLGAFSQRGKNSKARQLAVYQSAKSYPETLTMLNTMEEEGFNADRIDKIKSEVTNMFVTLKEVPADLSAPKRIAIAEKLNTIKRIEDAMASGISPFIADKMNDSIKKISDDIQNIILDPNYDKAFGKEVNEEVVKSESAPAQVEMPVIEITPTTEEIIVEGVETPTEEIVATETPATPATETTQPTQNDIERRIQEVENFVNQDFFANSELLSNHWKTKKDLFENKIKQLKSLLQKGIKTGGDLRTLTNLLNDVRGILNEGININDKTAILTNEKNIQELANSLFSLISDDVIKDYIQVMNKAMESRIGSNAVEKMLVGYSDSSGYTIDGKNVEYFLSKETLENAKNNKQINAKYDAESATLEETSGVSGSALKDVESTAKALDGKTEGLLPKPSDEMRIEDLKNKKFSTFIYNKESDVPEIFKDKITSKGTTNGKTEIRVTLPKSEADYYLNKDNPQSISEAYHKAKADGTNPELVKAVEDLLGKAPTQYTEAATPAKKESGGVSGSALKDVEGKKADIDRRTQEEFNNEKGQVGGEAKENTITDLNAKGKELFFEKPIRKEYQDGVEGDNKYAQDNIAHNKKVDDLILSINQNGTLADSNGIEYDVEVTSQGVRVSPKSQNDIKIYSKGKRVSGETPFTYGFKFTPTQEKVATETPVEVPAQSEAVKEDTTTTPTPTTDEKRNEEGQQKGLLTKKAEVTTNIPEAPPLTKVFVATSGNTIEENEMGNLVVKGKRGGILTGKERNKVIREYRKEKMTGGKRVTSADLERDNITEPEAVRYIAENSTSPEQLLEMMAVVEPKDAKLSGKDSFIADNMDAISAESWAKFGDTNRITPDIKKNFIGKNGTGIDQIAQAASYAMNPEGDGTEITPKDVIDFVEANQKGIKEALKAGNEDMKVLYDAFVSLTGRAPTRSMIADVKKEGADKKIEEDFGMEPEPQVFSVSDSPQMKKRRFTKQVMADKATKGTTKAKITEEAIYYLEQKNEMSVGEANKILEEVGVTAAIAILKDMNNNINGGVRSVLGQVIIKQLESTGIQADVDLAIDTLNYLTEKATDSGQFIQAFALWGYLTPAGQIRSAKRLIDEQRKDQFKKDSDKIKKTKRIIRDIQKEAIDETLANVGVEKKVGVRVNTNTKRSSPSYGSKNKVVTREKYLEAKAKLKGKLFSNPLDPALIPIATYHLEASGRKFADFAANLLDEFGSAVRPYIKDMYAAAKEELGGTGYDTVEDMDRVIAESQNEVWAERAKKITAKFDRALKTKSEKLYEEALAELLAHPNRDELWKKYKEAAAKKAANTSASLVAKNISEKPTLQIFADEMARLLTGKLKESMPKKTAGSTAQKPMISVVADAFKNPEKYREVIDAAREEILKNKKLTDLELFELDSYFGSMLDEPFSSKQIERVVKDGLKSIDKKVADIARAHYTQYDATKQTLIDKLVNEADLDFMQAKELGDAISKEFDRIMASKKSEILERMFKGKVTTKKGKVKHDLETELEKLLNLGAFSDEAIMNMWADANGYPKLTEENYKELERLAAIVVATPDGSKKFKAIQDLLKYQATIKGVDWKDVAMSVWYANVLSGYNTQLVNAVSTAINVMSNLMITSVRTMPTKGDRRMAVKGLYNGFATGLLVAKDVLTTGYSPIFTGKIEMPSALEIKRFMGGKYNPANWLKFVRRVMVATDVIFFEAAKEMRAYQLAAKMAREEGKVDPDLDTKNRALAILNKTDFDQNKIIQEETIEYEHELERINEMDVPAAMKEKLRKQALKGRSRRIFEITQQSRDLSVVEQSADFAARSTYNYPPEGALGALVKGINNWLNKLPFLRFFIPFTNIIANVANEQINYTPLGAVRAFRGGSITGNRPTEISAIDKADMYTKAAIGTTLMLATYILAKGFGDDDEPVLEITANGTGDYGKNYNLIKEGWQQYSFRFKKPDGTYTDWISYQYSPLQVGLSMIGNLMDFEKYRGEKADDETALKKLSLAFSASTRTFLDATVLSSLNDLLLIATNPFSEDAVSNFTKSIQNSAKSFVIPNLYTQGFKQVQASFDIPNKEVKETNLGWLLRDIPIFREMYNDQLDIFGNPVIPDTDKFFSGKDEDAPVYYEVAAGPLFNIKKPSIRTVKVEDPSTGEMTFLTPDEYYLFSKYRGEYLRDEIMKTVKAKKWDDFDKAYGTALQRDATYYAKDKIYDLRETYK